MIRIKYERYWNDFQRKEEEKSFADLAELADWIFGQMQQDYTKDNLVMSFPTPEKVMRIMADGPYRIEFKPQRGGESIWIYQIENSNGIIFSDGRFTSGQKHWSSEVKMWLEACEKRRRSPKFNFVDEQPAATKTIPYREYVLAECKRQWAECQEKDGHGPWAYQTEDEQKSYFDDMYRHLWDERKELDGVVLPEQPETDAWQKLNKLRLAEPLILEPEDWTPIQWDGLCKMCGLSPSQTERIVLHVETMESFENLEKKIEDADRTYTVTEMCPHCQSEVEMRWNTDTMGFKAFCPVCGKRLMLCDVCRQSGAGPCDFDSQTDTCRFNKGSGI